MLELIYQDEYGQRNIVDRNSDWQKLEKKAKELVTTENFENALNAEDQKRDFTVYYVDFFDKDGNRASAAYGGPKGVGGQEILIFDESGKLTSTEDANTYDVVPHFYIGQFCKSKNPVDAVVFYAEGARNGKVNKFTAGEIAGRGFYFIKA